MRGFEAPLKKEAKKETTEKHCHICVNCGSLSNQLTSMTATVAINAPKKPQLVGLSKKNKPLREQGPNTKQCV